jgi:hypothetical protein
MSVVERKAGRIVNLGTLKGEFSPPQFNIGFKSQIILAGISSGKQIKYLIAHFREFNRQRPGIVGYPANFIWIVAYNQYFHGSMYLILLLLFPCNQSELRAFIKAFF